ncbi:hypothetical protein SEA_JENOS_63 [Microbacterium phage Jenos]|nr:hypothetical protein SEA_JENOS_63 [Microbacterium phage Jenos]
MADSWSVEQMHIDDCALCEDAAESAITHAKVTGSSRASYSVLEPRPYDTPADVTMPVAHSATVSRA